MSFHRTSVRVYLEDTDAQGIVYHANYLKYCERSRTDMLGMLGYALADMQAADCVFVVFEMHLKFHRPARLHDLLEVCSEARKSSEYRVIFEHRICLEGQTAPIFTAKATVVAIDREGNLRPMPDGLLEDSVAAD